MGFLDFLKKKSSPDEDTNNDIPPLDSIGGSGDLPPLDSGDLPPLGPPDNDRSGLGSLPPLGDLPDQGSDSDPHQMFPDYSGQQSDEAQSAQQPSLPELSPAPQPHPDVSPTPKPSPELHTETVPHNKLPALVS